MNSLVAALVGLALLAAPAAAQQLFPDSHMVATDRFSVEVVGQGPDVALIPGLASSRETWRATAERLKGRYRLHLIQVAGFAGESARANAAGPVLIPTAQAIDAYIVANRLAPATLVGHSLGGTMALWLAEHHPEHLKKVMVVDSLPFFATVMMGQNATPEMAAKIAANIRGGLTLAGPAQEKMIDSMVTGPKDQAIVAAWGKASDPSVVKSALADDIELDLRPGLAAITTAVTLLYPDNVSLGAPKGAMDGFYGAAFAPVRGIRLERVDASRHFIMLDAPAAFAADLDAFLAS